jgi:tetratricopeptide (TPR) repeat protein
MNDTHGNAASSANAAVVAMAVDAKNPWLGLASFTEETREYFYGREAEVAELARRVQRKLLTILFGQSGLGKTSILRAGLVPRLRSQSYCPVYVRIDYGREAPEPADQIKAAISATARRSGEWTQAGVAVEGESLWEFLHHRDDVLKDEAGQTLVPLLIFDQFEEIFTLAQSDDFGRARAARFIADLSDLVENRPPKELEERLERDDHAAEKFDFARGDYRVLISLREDYLAPLEGLKSSMPSVTQNRLRLAPMTGTQALEAVRRPGGRLITEDVAAAIVRFVAGGAEIVNAEVEPSLLSLICRELNDKRIAEGRAEISLDLLAGSHATILAEFYERALADQPAAVRRVIEDELLTESGYRENIAEERIVSLFGTAGAAPGTLPLLVNRRLLRIEERLDVRRVELTHDVLCAIVKASRDLRHERETRDRTERLLSEQKERELAARRALKRARRIATGCAALALFAVVALAFAFVSLRRAQRAEVAAQESRAAAETARSHAEHLLGYLNEDFAVELAGFGTLGLIKQLGERETQYYDSLPPSLQTTDTMRSAALAQVHYGIAQQQAFDLKGARSSLTSAVATLAHLREKGDTSEESAIALGIGLAALADVNDRFGIGSTQSQEYNARAEALLRSYADAPNPSVPIRRAYGEVAMSVGSYATGKEALALFARAKQALESIGALKLTDLPASADFATLLGLEAIELWRLGRIDELKKVSEQGMQLANDILAQRPGHIVALQARSSLNLLGSSPAHEDLRIGDSAEFVRRALEDGFLLLRLDPANVDTRSSVANYASVLAGDYEELGRPRDARASLQKSLEILMVSEQAAVDHGDAVVARRASISRIDADLGERNAAEAAIGDAEPILAKTQAALGDDSYKSANAQCSLTNARARLALFEGDFKQAVAAAQPELKTSLTWKDRYGHVGSLVSCPSNAALIIGNAELMFGDYEAAKSAVASAVPVAAAANDWPSRNLHASLVVLQSIAMSRLGQLGEARALLTPVLDWQRARFARNRDDAQQRLDYASALYALALTDSAHRSELLNQASAIIAALPAEMRSLKSTRMWRDRVQVERGHTTAG